VSARQLREADIDAESGIDDLSGFDTGDDAEAVAVLPVPAAVTALALPEDSEPDRPASRVTVIVTAAGELYSALSARSLLQASPPPLAVLWENHRRAAACHNAAIRRRSRLAWGAGHCTAAGTLYLLIAVAFSPAGFVLFLAAVLACWLWL
jgi:hypothetical protein